MYPGFFLGLIIVSIYSIFVGVDCFYEKGYAGKDILDYQLFLACGEKVLALNSDAGNYIENYVVLGHSQSNRVTK